MAKTLKKRLITQLLFSLLFCVERNRKVVTQEKKERDENAKV
jgi:hypothetical protein